MQRMIANPGPAWQLARRVAPMVVALSLAAVSVRANVEMLLKADGIPGEVVDPYHNGWVRLNSLTFGEARDPTNSFPVFSVLALNAGFSKATPKLMEYCAKGTHIPKVRVELLKLLGSRLLFYEIDLKDAQVVSVANQAAGGVPVDSFGLNFARIEWTYTEYDTSGKPAGKAAAWWDLINNQGGTEDKPIFRATLGKNPAGGFSLSWGATAGRSYRIMASDQINGNYTELLRQTVEETGAASVTLPAEFGHRFFYLEEVPTPTP